MRSTLSTSAPNQAIIWVQAGPACTPVKSITLIPFRGGWFMMGFLSRAITLVSGHGRLSGVPEAFGVEVGQVAAFGARRWVDDAVDQCRRTFGQRVGEGCGQFGRCGGLITGAAERLDQPVVAGARRQRRG